MSYDPLIKDKDANGNASANVTSVGTIVSTNASFPFDVRSYGVKGDWRGMSAVVFDPITDPNTITVTSSSGPFTKADEGKVIVIECGAVYDPDKQPAPHGIRSSTQDYKGNFIYGNYFWTTIKQFNSNTQIVVNRGDLNLFPNLQYVKNASIQWGTDDTVALQKVLDFAADSTRTSGRNAEIYIPTGWYRFSQIQLPSGLKIYGSGWGSTAGSFYNMGTTYGGTAGGSATNLQQLEGSECDAIVYKIKADASGERTGFVELADFNLQGPYTGSIGSGISFSGVNNLTSANYKTSQTSPTAPVVVYTTSFNHSLTSGDTALISGVVVTITPKTVTYASSSSITLNNSTDLVDQKIYSISGDKLIPGIAYFQYVASGWSSSTPITLYTDSTLTSVYYNVDNSNVSSESPTIKSDDLNGSFAVQDLTLNINSVSSGSTVTLIGGQTVTGLISGVYVTGAGVQDGTTISSINTVNNSITLSLPIKSLTSSITVLSGKTLLIVSNDNNVIGTNIGLVQSKLGNVVGAGSQDGTVLNRIQIFGFPEDAFKFPKAGLPVLVKGCRAFYNYGYGVNFVGSYPDVAGPVKYSNIQVSTSDKSRFATLNFVNPISISEGKDLGVLTKYGNYQIYTDDNLTIPQTNNQNESITFTTGSLVYSPNTQVNDPNIIVIGGALGTATGTNSTSLTDSTANWVPNAFKDATISAISVSGTTRTTSTAKITSNTVNTITVSSWTSSAPANNATYTISISGSNASVSSDSLTLTVTSANWATNALKGAIITVASNSVGVIISNTSNTITVASWTGSTPTANSTNINYSISSTVIGYKITLSNAINIKSGSNKTANFLLMQSSGVQGVQFLDFSGDANYKGLMRFKDIGFPDNFGNQLYHDPVLSKNGSIVLNNVKSEANSFAARQIGTAPSSAIAGTLNTALSPTANTVSFKSSSTASIKTSGVVFTGNGSSVYQTGNELVKYFYKSTQESSVTSPVTLYATYGTDSSNVKGKGTKINSIDSSGLITLSLTDSATTSSTSNSIPTAASTKTFTLSSSNASDYVVNELVRIAYDANNYFDAKITVISGQNITVSYSSTDLKAGSGTYTSWKIFHRPDPSIVGAKFVINNNIYLITKYNPGAGSNGTSSTVQFQIDPKDIYYRNSITPFTSTPTSFLITGRGYRNTVSWYMPSAHQAFVATSNVDFSSFTTGRKNEGNKNLPYSRTLAFLDQPEDSQKSCIIIENCGSSFVINGVTHVSGGADFASIKNNTIHGPGILIKNSPNIKYGPSISFNAVVSSVSPDFYPGMGWGNIAPVNSNHAVTLRSFNRSAILSNALASTDQSIILNANADYFPYSGVIAIDNELVKYFSKIKNDNGTYTLSTQSLVPTGANPIISMTNTGNVTASNTDAAFPSNSMGANLYVDGTPYKIIAWGDENTIVVFNPNGTTVTNATYNTSAITSSSPNNYWAISGRGFDQADSSVKNVFGIPNSSTQTLEFNTDSANNHNAGTEVLAIVDVPVNVTSGIYDGVSKKYKPLINNPVASTPIQISGSLNSVDLGNRSARKLITDGTVTSYTEINQASASPGKQLVGSNPSQSWVESDGPQNTRIWAWTLTDGKMQLVAANDKSDLSLGTEDFTPTNWSNSYFTDSISNLNITTASGSTSATLFDSVSGAIGALAPNQTYTISANGLSNNTFTTGSTIPVSGVANNITLNSNASGAVTNVAATIKRSGAVCGNTAYGFSFAQSMIGGILNTSNSKSFTITGYTKGSIANGYIDQLTLQAISPTNSGDTAPAGNHTIVKTSNTRLTSSVISATRDVSSISTITIGESSGTSTTNLNGTVNVSKLTASQFVKTDSSKNLISATIASSDLPSVFIGITSVALNRSSGSQTLNGVNIDGSAGSAETVTNGVYVNVANTFTTGPQTIAPATDVKGIVVKASASQTANLLEIQPNGSTTPIAKINSSGNLTAASFVKTGGTASQFLKADGSVDSNTYLAGNVTSSGASINSNLPSTGLNTTDTVMDLASDFLFNARSSNCSTMSRVFATSNTAAVVSGTIYAVRAICVVGGTFTKIRFRTGSTQFSGLTDVRLGVWTYVSGASGTANYTTNTGNLMTGSSPSGTLAASTTFDNLSLNNSVTLAAGDIVFLGFSAYGTTMGTLTGFPAGNGPVLGALGIGSRLTYSATGWTGGNFSNLTGSGTTGYYPWIELVA
jgi:hypothetical protein